MNLNEICQVYSGYAFKEFHEDPTGNPVIKIGSITNNGSIDTANCSYTNEIVSDRYLSRDGDIYIALSGATTGKIGLMKENNYCINQRVGVVRLLNNNIPINYLCYFLQSKTKKILSDAAGAAQPNISPKDISRYQFPERKVNEMTTISNELLAIDNAIKVKKTELNNLNELIKSQFIEMFGDPVDNDKQWNVKTLNEITDVRDGTHDSPKYVDKGYPFVTSKNLINGTIDFSTCQLITEKDYLHFNDRSCVDDGDILMPMIGTIGGAIIVNKDRDFAIKNVALVKFTKNNNLVNRQFILNILNSDSMNDYFSNTKKGGTQKFISLGEIRKIPVILPPIDLQNKFASFVEQIDKSKFIVQKQINDLQELLDSKMQEYFGEEE